MVKDRPVLTGSRHLWLLFLILILVGIAASCRRAEAPTAVAEQVTAESSLTNTPAAPGATASNTVPAENTATPNPGSTPATPTATVADVPGLTATYQQFLPSAGSGAPTATPTATNTPLPTPTPTIDFNAVRAGLQAQGQDLGFVKIGFHVGPGGNRTGLGDWMNRLDAAGVPFFLKSVDDSGALVEAQNIVARSGIDHTLVYRKSGDEFDTPDYSLPPRQAAEVHWALHLSVFPPELDKNLVWLETINEVDKNQAAWLAEFSLATAEFALRDGYRWAAFGWSSGEPEPTDWQTLAMVSFLRLAAANPDHIAIALHEYSFLADDIGHEYPFKVGRFQSLFAVTDSLGLARPTILITEWGWAYQEVPDPDRALADIAWAARLYAPYPEVKGAAIWYLGPGFGDIATPTQRLIAPLTEYALGNYFPIPLPPNAAPIVPESYRP